MTRLEAGGKAPDAASFKSFRDRDAVVDISAKDGTRGDTKEILAS
jgi:hypothetical protein